MTDLEELLAEVTPGKRVRFHPSYCPEAEGTPFTVWDTSHDTSVILPDGSVYRRYAVHKHAIDAALDAMAPTLARKVIAAEKLADALRPTRYRQSLTAEEANKIGDALAAWEAAQ